MDSVRLNLYSSIFLKTLKKIPSRKVLHNCLSYQLSKISKNDHLAYFPMSIVLYVNKTCNLDCPFCYNKELLNKGSKSETDMTKEQMLKIMNSSFGEKALRVALMGGEPFLNPLIFDFIEECSRRKKITNVVTNATTIKGNQLDKLKCSPVDVVGISLYENNHEDVARVVCELNKSNKTYWVQTIADAKKLKQLEDDIIFCSKINCKSLILSNYNPYFDKCYDSVIYDDNQNYLDLKKNMLSKKINMNLQWVSLIPRESNNANKKCKMPFSYVHIDNQGALGPCCFRYPESEKFGSIYSKENWNNRKIKELRENLNSNCKPIDECSLCENLYQDLYGI